MYMDLSMARIVGYLSSVIIFFTVAITKSRQQDNFYFDPAPIDVEVIEGEEAKLRCDVSNRKHITFYWTLNDRPVSNTSRRFQEDSDLRILRVNREEDAGSFRCIATNVTTGVSLRSIEARLNLFYIDKIAEVHLRHPKTEAAATLGDYINLKCHAEGNPEPQVDWFKNKIRLFSSDRVKFHKNRLKITNITADDNGVYSCRARNPAGVLDSSDNFVLNIQAEEGPILDEESFTEVVLTKEGDRAQFNCVFQNMFVTEWYFEEKMLVNSTGTERVRIYPNGTLVINDCNEGDKGIYKCKGIGQNGPSQTFVSELILAYLGDLTDTSFDPIAPKDLPKVIPVNQKLEVKCFTPQGLPPPSQRWEDPNGQALPDNGRIKVAENRLYISNANPSDSGNYSCISDNLAGTKRKDYWIVVSEAPVIVRPPLSVRVQEDESAAFDCRMSGTPYPVSTIKWLKENKPIDETHPRFRMDLSGGTLTIKDVHLNDEGNYACVVNTTGHPPVMSTQAHLYVTKKLKFKPSPVNTKLELGTKSRIHCNAEGQTSPRIYWLKDGKVLFPNHIQDIDGILIFETVQREDAGYYTCEASNSQGTINATIYVDVVVKPQFRVKPSNTTGYEGYPIMLHCVATGDPTPTIQWDKNSKVNSFDFERFKILPNGSLFVSKVYMEDMGKYGCTAGNSGGFEREEIYVNVAPGSYMGDMHAGRYHDENFSMMKTIIIAVCSAVAYLAVVIGLTVYCSIRLVKAKNLRKNAQNETTQPLAPSLSNAGKLNGSKIENGVIPNEHTELMDKRERDSSILKSDDNRSHVSGVSSHHSHSSHSGQSSSRRRSYDKFSFPRHDLQTLGMLGKGHFGDVFLAKAHGIRDLEGETLVVVKSLLSRDEQHLFEFRREIDLFGKVNHEHVARLLGVCREMEPQFLITEYCEWGDLKQFLWATRKDNVKRNPNLAPLTLTQKINMCNQVVLGMEHLSNLRLVHKDLASRNVLLSPNMDLKVANLGLCRDVYMAEYYPMGSSARLVPLRWLSPEALLDEEYSIKSDIWAFGVFCYEMFTLGDMPYKKRSDEEVRKGLMNGDCILDPPPNCPKEMHEVIEKCTAENPKDRPSFSELAVFIGELTVDSDV